MRLFFTSALLILSTLIHAQPEAYFDYKIFGHQGNKINVEVYLNFIAESLNYTIRPDNSAQARVLTTIVIEKDSVVIDFSKIEISSPLSSDSVYQDFVALQRFSIEPGTYDISIEIRDINRSENAEARFSQKLYIPEPQQKCYLSEILFIDTITQSTAPNTYSRGNQDLSPYISTYFPSSKTNLRFYAEIFQSKLSVTDSSGAFLCLYKIAHPKTGAPFRNYQKVLRLKTADVIPILADLDISQLPSGNFKVIIELRSRNNELIASASRDFQRQNYEVEIPSEELEQMLLDNSFVGYVNSLDTLSEFIYCLRPIGTEKEKQQIDHQKDLLPTLDLKKRFFYAFWASRNAIEPATAWADYKKEVAIAQALFKTRIKKGYETDRGRVYLQYGPPNVRSERPTEPSAYPYEIWHYYRIKQYSNKRFVFWNQDLVSNDYELLHSDMYGEPKNPNWQNYLSKRNSSIDNPDKRAADPTFGDRSQDFFNNPR